MTGAPLLVAILGAGLVGTELISQIEEYNDSNKDTSQTPFRVVAIANSKTYILETNLKSWKEDLKSSSKTIELDAFVKDIVNLAKGRPLVLVDNTASQQVADKYPHFLQAGLHIVTPNKKAFSGSQQLYNDILSSAKKTKVDGKPRLIYQEATVGAGLPIISTLQDLIITGDQITKIEGVFSGTLSYIFNEFSSPAASEQGKKKTFSSIVKGAKESGYTEPHPGDDLNGLDVARKLTILTRLIDASGSVLPLENGCHSVDTKSLVPDALTNVTNGSEFVEKLSSFDQDFTRLDEAARKQGKVVRYVGKIDLEHRIVKASLERSVNPF